MCLLWIRNMYFKYVKKDAFLLLVHYAYFKCIFCMHFLIAFYMEIKFGYLIFTLINHLIWVFMMHFQVCIYLCILCEYVKWLSFAQIKMHNDFV